MAVSVVTLLLITNYLALVVTTWLGWYVVTRSPHNLLSWLTSLTLWSLGGLFLNTILALTPLPRPIDSPGWLQLFFPFWSLETFSYNWSGWLQGWQVVPAIIFWHHATILIRPGKLTLWRWARVIFGYAMALFGIWVMVTRPLEFADISSDPIYLNTLKPGPFYVPFLFLLLFFIGLCLINIIRAIFEVTVQMARRQLITLAIATFIAGFTAPVAYVATALNLPISRLAFTFLLTIAVALIGYGVARYSALTEGRTIRRDILYNAVAMGTVVAVYSLVTWVSVRVFDVPAAAFVFVIMLAIITHNLVDIARHTLDSVFFRRENRQIRENLRKLAGQVGEQELEENLSMVLEVICHSVRAAYGLVVLFEQEQVHVFVSFNDSRKRIKATKADFLADDILHLEPNQFPPPLEEAALLVPLYVDTVQIGAIILGRPPNSTKYSKEDIELLLYPSDQLSEIIYKARREAEYLQQLSDISAPKHQKEKISTREVENALRNIHDYALLGSSPLANLKLVEARLAADDVTYLDRGKVVNRLLSEALEKLRPGADLPRNPPPREWHAYLILHEAYLEDQLNRDIMSKLYISEGTFNRTRRAAIRSVARALEEMETRHH
jgi:hypothetical protein